jgi:hypothetical protein
MTMKARIKTPIYSDKDLEQHVFELVVDANLPFSIVEHPKFISLVQYLNPDAKIPSRKRVKDILDEDLEEQDTESVLPGLGEKPKVSLAIDCWTSANHLSFLGITGYYILEEWNFTEVLLGFEPVDRAHTGQHLAEIVKRVLEKHGLQDRLLAITTDNASNNGTLCQELESSMSEDSITWNSKAMQVSCLAHVINLSSQALLSKLSITDHSYDTAAPELFGDGPPMSQQVNIQTTVSKV